MTRDQWPRTNDQGPVTRDHGSGTKDQGPMTRDQWPGTNDQGPRTKDQWPGTNDQWPGTNDQGPWTKDQGPMTRDQWPATNNQGPMTRDLVIGHWSFVLGHWSLVPGHQGNHLLLYFSRYTACLTSQMEIPGRWGCRPGVNWLYKHITWADTFTIHHPSLRLNNYLVYKHVLPANINTDQQVMYLIKVH